MTSERSRTRPTDDPAVITPGEAPRHMLEESSTGKAVLTECPLCGAELGRNRANHFRNEHTADELVKL